MSDDADRTGLVVGNAAVVVLSSANDAQRNAVQAIVKAHATSWWHQHADAWIVDTTSAQHVGYWRDLIRPVLALTTASVLVLQLPGREEPRWWASGNTSDEGARWLYESYTGSRKPGSQALTQ